MKQAAIRTACQGWEATLQILHRQIYDSTDSKCLLWVNPAQGDVFAENTAVKKRQVRVPISHVRFDPQFAPYLVELDLSKFVDADIFNASVEMAWNAWTHGSLSAHNGQPIAGWIEAIGAPSDLAQYWAQHCYLHPLNGLTKLLRFHDPGVREWLWPTLSPAQKRQLLGPVRKLMAFGREQCLVQQGIDEIPDAERLTPASLDSRFCLTAHQWSEVEDYATLHAAWLHWGGTDPEKRSLLAEKSNWAEKTLAALRYATRYGIEDPEDRRLFATHALQIGDNFHTHSKLQSVWQKTREGDFYGGALEELTGLPVGQLAIYLKNQ
jgi:hypothetical protein